MNFCRLIWTWYFGHDLAKACKLKPWTLSKYHQNRTTRITRKQKWTDEQTDRFSLSSLAKMFTTEIDILPVVNIMEELVEAQTLPVPSSHGQDGEVARIETLTESTKHTSYCQIVF